MDSGHKDSLQLIFSRKIRKLFYVDIALVLLSLAVTFISYRYETSFNTVLWIANTEAHSGIFPWYAYMKLTTCSIFIYLIYRHQAHNDRYVSPYWKLLLLVTIYFATDEILRLSEIMLAAVNNNIWAIALILIFSTFCYLHLKHLTKLKSDIKNIFFLASIVFISGSVFFEVTNFLASSLYAYGSDEFDLFLYILLMTAEELIKMLGASMLFYALLRYMNQQNIPAFLSFYLARKEEKADR